MAHRWLSTWSGLGILALTVNLSGQRSAPETTPVPKKSPQAWSPSRTPDGQPDLHGYWTNATYTPLERPAELAGKEFFTPDEAAAYERQRLAAFLAQPKDNVHYDDAIWQTEKYGKGVSNLRTSLIVDPKDGRIPPMTAEGQQRAADRAAARRNPSDAAENRNLMERCISWGSDAPPMLPPIYYANLQIVQGTGYVAIITEAIHNVRMVPLDGRPHLGRNLPQLLGDSRGRWEGNTLVVDTTNFTDKTAFRGSGPALHVVERFTRVDADTIRYEFTVEDPHTWTRPWSAELAFRKMAGPLYEYACTEGNYGLANILRGARVEEARAAAE